MSLQSKLSNLGVNCVFLKIISFLCLFFISIHAEASWQKLAAGIEYQDLGGNLLTPWSHIYAFRVDLRENQFGLIKAQSLGLKNASSAQFAERSQALISINGGFFDHDFNPLGLRINEGKIENPIKSISWWGVFTIKNNKAKIFSLSQFNPSKKIDFAIQAGPRLLVNNRIPPLKAGDADRTALGITADNRVIIVVTSNAAMSTSKLAYLLRSKPLSCVDAINLDGGSSSQLYAHLGSFLLNARGFSHVSDAVVVKSK